MTPERWQRIEELFAVAKPLSVEERRAYLANSCADEPELRGEVERLLTSNDQAPDFIETPALEVAASQLANSQQTPVGKIIGRYSILSLIGVGGMGAVYLAEDTALGRKVALKLLLPSYQSKDHDSLRRFQNEARAASALNHPNTAHIYEIGETDGSNYIAMEYVEGQSLDSRINGSPLDSIELLDVGIQVSDALQEAHQKGITHRDIKSANIIIGPQGRVKVLDFGLAKTETPIEQSSKETGEVKTRPGVVLGTISYMSPEQALGKTVDTRTDLFSLGAVLYEMATGRLPFKGETVTQTVDQILHSQPESIARWNYNVPEELERIVRKALRKGRDERYQTAKDLLVDLKNLRRELDWEERSDGLTSGETRARRQNETTNENSLAQPTINSAQSTSSVEYIVGGIRRHKLGTVLAATIALAIFAVAAVLFASYLRRTRVENVSAAKTIKSWRLIKSATGGKVGNTSISPDGKFVVYKDDEVDRRQGLWIRQVATGAARPIVPADQVVFRGTTFSSDGNLVYYVVQSTNYPTGALFHVSVIGGESTKLLSNILTPISLSPDGKQFSYSYERSLMVANIDGSDAHKVAPTYGAGQSSPSGPAWSPDGKYIAYGSMRSDGGPYAQVFTLAVDTGDVKQITNEKWGSVRRTLWLADGKGLILLASDPEQDFSQIWEVSYPSGEVRRITSDLNGHGHISLGLTADSGTLVTQQEDDVSHLWLVPSDNPADSKQITVAEGGTEGRFGLAWSGEEELIYSLRGDRGWNLWRTKADGTEQRSITSEPYWDEYPVVSSDGGTLVFLSTRQSGIYHVWTATVNGKQAKPLTSAASAEDHSPRLSPDGRWVVYSSVAAGKSRLWRIATNGGEPKQLTDYQTVSPDISPDGKSIACAFLDESLKPARWKVAIVSSEGGPPLRKIDLPASADINRSTMDGRAVSYVRWLPGGQAIAYVDLQNGASNIWSQPISGGAPKQLTAFSSGLIFNFAVSPDGKQIACSRGTRSSDVILITEFR